MWYVFMADTDFLEEIDTQIVRLFTYSLFSKCYSAKLFFPQSISHTRQASVFLTSLEGWGTHRSQMVILSSYMRLWTKGVRKTWGCLQSSCLVLQPMPSHTHREEQLTLMKSRAGDTSLVLSFCNITQPMQGVQGYHSCPSWDRELSTPEKDVTDTL